MIHLVLSTYRSGSTYFCEKLAEKYSALCLDEWFHPLHTREKGWRNLFRVLYTHGNFVVKVMPDQIPKFESGFPEASSISQIIMVADTIHVLARKDFNAQCISSYVASKTNDWHGTWEGKVDIEVGRDYEELHVPWCKKNIILLARIYHYASLVDDYVEVKYLEDLDGKPYSGREYNLIGDVPVINYDVQRLFEDEEYMYDELKNLLSGN